MKISSVAVYTADVQLAGAGLHMSGGRSFHSLEAIIVRLDTDAGISGFGEVCPCGAHAGYVGGIIAGLKLLAPKLIGLNPLELEQVNQVIDREMCHHPRTKSPVDMACWDILGKYTKLPLYTLMGGRLQDTIQTVFVSSSPNMEELCAEAAAKKQEGYTVFQLTLTQPRHQFADRMRAYRQAVGNDVTIYADANTGLLCRSAIQLARDTADLKYMIEQPCKSIRDCRDVRNSASVPMIQDETMVDIPAILQAYHEGAIDMVKLKISRLGGLTRTRQARDLCITLGITFVIEDGWGSEITSAALAHLGHSTPEANLCGILNFTSANANSLAKHEMTMSGSRLSISETPGLGVTPDMEKLGNALFVFTK